MNSTNSARGQATDWEQADRQCKGNGAWTPLNIALMVLGFVLFWPIGLAILFGIMAGIKPMELPWRIGAWFDGMKGQMGNPFDTKVSGSGNHVFDEYQQTQMDRIEEIKAEVRDRSDRFNRFKGDEERQRQQEQFDRFMGRPQQD